MTFYRLPIGYAEWRVDSRDPRPARIATDELLRRRAHGRRREHR